MAKKILIVDDLLLDVVLTRRALADCAVEHQIVAVADGVDAIRMLDGGQFDLVLLDLKMPRADGFDVLKQLRNMPSASHIPIVVLSGSDLAEDRARVQVLGGLGYVYKATDYSEFRGELKYALIQHGFC